MATNAATPTPIDLKLYPKFGSDLTITPLEVTDLVAEYDQYTAYQTLIDEINRWFRVVDPDVIQLSIRYQAILAVAYQAAEASGWTDYGLLPDYTLYLNFIELFNEHVKKKGVVLRDKHKRPSESSDVPAIVPETATTAELAKAINELMKLLANNQRESRPGRIKRIAQWFTEERQPGAHS